MHLSDTEELGANAASSEQNKTCLRLCCSLMAVSQPQFITTSASCIVVVSYFYTYIQLTCRNARVWLECVVRLCQWENAETIQISTWSICVKV